MQLKFLFDNIPGYNSTIIFAKITKLNIFLFIKETLNYQLPITNWSYMLVSLKTNLILYYNLYFIESETKLLVKAQAWWIKSNSHRYWTDNKYIWTKLVGGYSGKWGVLIIYLSTGNIFENKYVFCIFFVSYCMPWLHLMSKIRWRCMIVDVQIVVALFDLSRTGLHKVLIVLQNIIILICWGADGVTSCWAWWGKLDLQHP